MKLRRTTLFLLISAFLLGSFVYFYITQETSRQEATNSQKQQLFSFSREDIQNLLIETSRTTLEFEGIGNPVNSWQMKKPEVAPASNATVSFLVDLLVDGQRKKNIQVSAARIKEYGLEKPQATIRITLKNKETHQIILGHTDFEDKWIYAKIDPMPGEEVTVTLVDRSFQDALDRDLSEWKQNP